MSKYLYYAMLVAALLPLSSKASLSAEQLFSTEETLNLTITAPFHEINKARNKEQHYGDATVSYTGPNAQYITVPVTLSVRGNSRLERRTCAFPPLKLKFAKKDREGTLFADLKKVKLVTQCQPKFKRSKDELLKEYQAYRILNELTDKSYRVQLLRVEYADSRKDKAVERYAFFIEPSRNFSKRNNVSKLDTVNGSSTILNGRHMNLISLYQMLIGNTDWSATKGGIDECCHNGKLFGDASEQEALFVPYDFDMTGLVGPKYAVPPSNLKLSSVQERRYRGYCRNNNFLVENVSLLNNKREDISQILRQDMGMSKAQVSKSVRYVDRFYERINDTKRFATNVNRFCLGERLAANGQGSS